MRNSKLPVKNHIGVILIALALLTLGTVVPAQADDATWSGTFDDLNQLTTTHVDQDPWKGWFDLTAYNNTSSTWGDFHFMLFDIPSQPTSDVIFVDASGGGNDPTSTTTTIDSWVISNGGKTLDVFYYGDPVAPTETLNIKVWTDNTSNMQDFGVAFYPTVVPEPVSSTLFVVGAATLGFRRFRKHFKK